MSEIIELKQITAPSLNQPGYGKGIDDQFKAISENFYALANRDFVKGDQGISVRTRDIKLMVDKNTLSLDGFKILDAIITEKIGHSIFGSSVVTSLSSIESMFSQHSELVSLTSGDKTISILDGFTTDASITIVETYDPSAVEKVYTPAGSINGFVFRDPRFYSHLLSDNVEAFSELVDLTCSVHMTTVEVDYVKTATGTESVLNAKYTVVNDLPSLYYDSDINTFCWKLGNQRTGMIAQGPAGKNGAATSLRIFKSQIGADKFTGVASITAKSILVNGWKDVTSDVIENNTIKSGDTCVLYLDLTKDNVTPTTNVYFARISKVDGDEVTIYCDPSTELKSNFDADTLENILTFETAAKPTSSLTGLHVPYDATSNNRAVGYRHMIWSLTEGSDNQIGRNILRISPLNYSYFKDHRTSPSQQISANGKLRLDYGDVIIGYRELNATDFFRTELNGGLGRCGSNKSYTLIGANQDWAGVFINHDGYAVHSYIRTLNNLKTLVFNDSNGNPIYMAAGCNIYKNEYGVWGGNVAFGEFNQESNTMKSHVLIDSTGLQAVGGNGVVSSLQLNKLGGTVFVGGVLNLTKGLTTGNQITVGGINCKNGDGNFNSLACSTITSAQAGAQYGGSTRIDGSVIQIIPTNADECAEINSSGDLGISGSDVTITADGSNGGYPGDITTYGVLNACHAVVASNGLYCEEKGITLTQSDKNSKGIYVIDAQKVGVTRNGKLVAFPTNIVVTIGDPANRITTGSGEYDVAIGLKNFPPGCIVRVVVAAYTYHNDKRDMDIHFCRGNNENMVKWDPKKNKGNYKVTAEYIVYVTSNDTTAALNWANGLYASYAIN